MSIECDRWIGAQAAKHPMTEPFSEKQIAGKIQSCGLPSYGYDRRVANEFKSFTCVKSAIIDPKQFDKEIVRFGRGRFGDHSAGLVRAGAFR